MSTNNSHEDPLSPNYTPPILSGIPNLSSIPIRSPLPGQPQPHFRPQPLPPPPSNSVWSISSQPPPLTPRSPQAYSSPSRERERERERERMDRDDYSPSRSTSTAISPSTPNTTTLDAFVRIKILALEKSRREIYIKFNAETNLPSFRSSLYRSVSRSHTEFIKFAEAVSANNPQSIVPALPLVQSSSLNDQEDDRIVKANYGKWVARICLDGGIVRDEELRNFIESEFGYTPSTRSRRKTPSTFHFPRGSRLPGEVDDSLTLAKSSMSKLELQFQETAKLVEKLSRARRNVALTYLEVSDKFNTFATTENYKPLSEGIKKLSRVLKVQAEVLANQATSELVTLGDSLNYQSLNAKSAKETLLSRDVIVDEHRLAAKATIAKRRNIERLKGGSNLKSERVDEALEELDDAKRHETLLTTRLSQISQHLEPSLRQHSLHAHQDILLALLDHSKSQLLYEKLWLKELELVAPEFHKIRKFETGVIYHSTPVIGGPSGDSANRGVVGNTPPRSSSINGGVGAGGGGSPGSPPLGIEVATKTVGRGGPNWSEGDSLGGHSGLSSMAKTVPKRSIHSMAKSVVVTDDRRQRVDAKMAASMLANGF